MQPQRHAIEGGAIWTTAQLLDPFRVKMFLRIIGIPGLQGKETLPRLYKKHTEPGIFIYLLILFSFFLKGGQDHPG